MRIQLPLKEDDLKQLHAGDRVLLSGILYTARDAAHKRMQTALDEGKPLPFDIRGETIYYMGPSPAREGRSVGSAGPTTASRMDVYTPALLRQGLRGMIGKGRRSAEVLEAIKKQGAVYFAATGGAGALLSKCITASEVIAYEDLGTEAVRRLTIEDFPVIVAADRYGGYVYDQSPGGSLQHIQ